MGGEGGGENDPGWRPLKEKAKARGARRRADRRMRVMNVIVFGVVVVIVVGSSVVVVDELKF